MVNTQLLHDQTITSSPSQDAHMASTVPHEFDNTPLSFKSLNGIYERCNFCMVELECFEEASRNEAWRKVMSTWIEMIEKKWYLWVGKYTIW